VLMLAYLVILALVVGRVLRVAHPNRVGGLTEVIAQVAVAASGQSRLLRLEISRLMVTPFQAGEFGHLGLVVVETLHASDFGDDAGGEDGAEAGDGIQGVGDGGHPLGDGRVEPLLLLLQESDGGQAHPQNEVDWLLERLWQWVGIAGDLLELAGIGRRVRETPFALAVDVFDQLVEGEGGDLFEGGEFLEHRAAGSAKEVGEGFQAGVLAGLEIEDGQAVGLLAGQVVDEVVAIAGEQPHREVALLVVERGGEVAAQAQPVGGDESVNGVAVIQVHIGALEVGRQTGVAPRTGG